MQREFLETLVQLQPNARSFDSVARVASDSGHFARDDGYYGDIAAGFPPVHGCTTIVPVILG